ncbi:MAG: capsular polysaccharide export protein [Oceanicoccus sp.]|jgi:capsular polysaccharide export protein
MKILLVIENIERYLFFKHIAKILSPTHDIEIATNNKLAHLLLKNKYRTYLFNTPSFLFETNSFDRIIIWNGCHMLGEAIAEKSAIEKIRFWELSNLPSKIQSSKYGVNAKSEIFSKPSLLDAYPEVDDNKHREWLNIYYQEKMKPPAQSKVSPCKLTYIFFSYLLSPTSLSKSTVENLKSLFIKIKTSNKKNNQQLLPENFIFFPCQVSTDTQITINSNTNNIAAIETAFNIATKKAVDLVVKIHPAEKSFQEITRIKQFCQQPGITLCNNNTAQLLGKCIEVITINSTVGLEALIYNKPVTTLGKAVYSDFDQSRLKKYIHHHLISDIDYFNPGKASTNSVTNAIM